MSIDVGFTVVNLHLCSCVCSSMMILNCHCYYEFLKLQHFCYIVIVDAQVLVASAGSPASSASAGTSSMPIDSYDRCLNRVKKQISRIRYSLGNTLYDCLTCSLIMSVRRL